MSPKVMEEYTELRKKQITEKAWECFCEMGYDKSTVRDIAKRMGTSTGVIYNYFSCKEEILVTLLEFSINQNEFLFKSISEKITGTYAIKKAFSMGFVEYPLERIKNNNKGNISLWAEAIKNSNVKSQLVKFYTDFKNHFQVFIKQAIKEGNIKENAKIEIAADYYLALFIGLQVQQVILDKTFSKSYVKHLMDIIFNHKQEKIKNIKNNRK